MVRRWWESRLTLPVHNLGQCRLSWWVCARLRKAASRIVGFVQISRSWKDFAVRNGKFVSTVYSIKTSRTCAKMWLILLGKQFRSVTQPRDKRDTESRRSADNLASWQTSSHSVYQAITFTSSLTERFDSIDYLCFPLLLYWTWLKLSFWSRCDHERNYCCIGRCQIKMVHQTSTQIKGSHARGDKEAGKHWSDEFKLLWVCMGIIDQ